MSVLLVLVCWLAPQAAHAQQSSTDELDPTSAAQPASTHTAPAEASFIQEGTESVDLHPETLQILTYVSEHCAERTRILQTEDSGSPVADRVSQERQQLLRELLPAEEYQKVRAL